jgi:hypothetical protein
VLFSCTSTDADCGWEAYSGASSEIYAVGPELFLVARGPYSRAETEIPGVLVQDFALSFTAKLTTSGPPAGKYGAAFRHDPANEESFYEFELSSSGDYWIWEWVNDDLEMLDRGSVELDPGGQNSVTISAQGPLLSFLVNGKSLSEITDAKVREGPLRLAASVVEEAEIEVAVSEVTVQTR